MRILKQNVGIDISMEEFEVNVSVLLDSFEKKCLGIKSFSNTPEGFMRFLIWMESVRDKDINETYTMEFTGVYYESLAYHLLSKGKVVNMVVPSKAKKYFESLSYASKTDRLDAQALSWMGLERKLKEWSPVSLYFRKMKLLTRERAEILKEKTMVRNRVHANGFKATSSVGTKKRYNARIKLLEKQIKEIEDELQALLKEDELLNQRIKKLTSIPGVGFITAATVVAETNGFAAIMNQKQLTSYAGLDVKLKQSGKYQGISKISKQGNSHIRRSLHFPAQVAAIHNKPLSVFYERVKSRKAKAMIAGVAVQRKLLCLMYTLWKNDTVFDPEYEMKKLKQNIKKQDNQWLPCAG